MKPWILGILVVSLGGLAAACTPPPEPTPWMKPGCYQGLFRNTFGSNDVYYYGPVDEIGNASLFVSNDGTCTGSEFPGGLIVRATDYSAANDKCAALVDPGPGIGDGIYAEWLEGRPTGVATDAYRCMTDG